MFAKGLPYLAIPGPSVMPDRVLRAMQRPAPNIYTGALHEMTHSLIPDLRAVAGTTGDAAIYIANGHGTWEAALANVVSEDDRVLVLATGVFCKGWGEMARGLGVGVELLDFGESAPVDPGRVEAALRADRAGRIKAVLMVLVDTSTGVRNDVAAVRAAVDAVGHDALLMVDAIASLGCDIYEMDASGVDVTIAASQKGLMTPPGLGFVWFNERADMQRGTLARVSRYWDWRPRVNPDEYWKYFDGTAPTHHLFALREALDMIAEEGLTAIWARHDGLARAIWAACEAWGQAGPLRLNVPDAAARSRAITSVGLEPGQGDALRRWVEQAAGVTLGIGLGRDPASAYFRIGHMGHVNAHMVLGVLASIESALIALDIPHGPGGTAAASAVLADLAQDLPV